MLKPPVPGKISKHFLVACGALLLVIGVVYFVFRSHLTVAVEVSAARRELGDGNASEALRRLESLNARYSQQSQILYWLAVAQRRLDNLSSAEAHLAQAELLGWNQDDIALQRALLACRAGQFSQVEQLFRTSLVNGVPDEVAVDIYDAMSTGYVASFRWRDALECLDYWSEWQPKAVKPRLLRAAIFHRMQRGESAISDYRAILSTDPTHAEARLKLGDSLVDLHRPEDAIAEYRIGFEQHPEEFAFKIGIARCQRLLGELTEAKTAIDEVLKERLNSPVRAEALLIAGEIQLDAGGYEESIRYLDSAARLTPQEPRVHRSLAMALRLSGNSARGKVHQELSEKLAKDSRRLSEIVDMLRASPDRVDLRHEAGQIMAANAFHGEALGWWKSALTIDPKHRPSHLALAEEYRRLGIPQSAELHRQLALKSADDSATDDPATTSDPSDSKLSNSANEAQHAARP